MRGRQVFSGSFPDDRGFWCNLHILNGRHYRVRQFAIFKGSESVVELLDDEKGVRWQELEGFHCFPSPGALAKAVVRAFC